nr:hypothetical protein [Tanacetum cinerariifolium]
MAQNIDFSGFDQIQTPQYLEIHPQSQETSDEVFQANHSIQNEESLENSSNEIAASNPNQEKEEPPQDSDFHQLIEECSTEIYEEQKQSMEDTMLELVKICQEKEFLCIHDNVDDLIEKFQSCSQEFYFFEYISNFSIHAIAPVLSTKEPEHLLSMGYEHLSITPETESDEVIESNAKNLLPIPRECEEMLINLVKNDISDDSSNNSLLEEFDLFLSDNSIPPGIENIVDDPEGDVRFLEELLIDDSILSHESSDSNFEDNPSVPQPPPKPPEAETNAGEEIPVVMNEKDEYVDYSSFIFVIFDKMFSLLSAESEDTILILVSPIRSSDFSLGWNFHLHYLFIQILLKAQLRL